MTDIERIEATPTDAVFRAVTFDKDGRRVVHVQHFNPREYEEFEHILLDEFRRYLQEIQ